MAKKVEQKEAEVKEEVVAQVEEKAPVAEPKAEAKEIEKVGDKPKFVPSDDAVANKNFAWLAYILFFIPLLINSQSSFVRHHANEGLEINIFDFVGLTLLLVGSLVNSTVAAVHFLMLIFVIIGAGLLVLTIITKIYMIVATLQGKETSTPWMWNIRIIK